MKSHRDTVLWRQTQQTAYTTLNTNIEGGYLTTPWAKTHRTIKKTFIFPVSVFFVVPIAAEDIFITDVILKI